MGGRPQWVDDPLSACQEIKELCAVGVAADEKGAESEARKSLAQIFATKVVASSRSSKTSDQSSDAAGLLSGRTDENTYSDIQEMTDEVLKGVIIKSKYLEKEKEKDKDKDREKYYALASLDKWAMSKDMEHDMGLLDEKMKLLAQKKGPGVRHKLLGQYEKREAINQRYQFLKGRAFPKALNLNDIEKTRSSQESFPVVAFVWDHKDAFARLAPFIAQLLTENEFKVVTKKSERPASYNLKGKLKVEEQFLKVEGFKKYHFQLTLAFENPKGEKVNTVEFEDYESGRTFDQAYALAETNMRKFLQEKIPDLEWE